MSHAPARLAQLTHHLAPPSSSSSSPSSNTPHRSASSSARAGDTPNHPARPQPPRASEFRYFLPFQTRWADNDKYGHMNNVVYSLYFDSITNHYLIHQVRRPSPSSPPPLGLIVSSITSYSSSLSYPSPLIAALAVSRLSARSVTWRVALFEGEYVPSEEGGGGGMEGFDLEALGKGEMGRQVRVRRDIKGEEVKAAAWGEMVHVFVDQESRRPVKEMDEGLRGALERLLVKREA